MAINQIQAIVLPRKSVEEKHGQLIKDSRAKRYLGNQTGFFENVK